MLVTIGIATLLSGIITFFRVGKYKVETKEYMTYLIILCIPFFNANTGLLERLPQVFIALVIGILLFMVIPFVLVGDSTEVYMNLTDVYEMFEGLDLFINSEVLILRNGVRVYVLEDGSKVKAYGKGRLKITIRKGFEFNRIREIRKIIITEVVKIDSRVHTYGEVALFGVVAIVFFVAGYQLR